MFSHLLLFENLIGHLASQLYFCLRGKLTARFSKRLFVIVDSMFSRLSPSFCISSKAFSRCRMDLNMLDPTQLSLLKEECIAVDQEDKPIGSITKEGAHLLGPQGALPPLHRAFSVFLFNEKNELLMQQRSKFKITFPGNYNSHFHILNPYLNYSIPLLIKASSQIHVAAIHFTVQMKWKQRITLE